MSVPAARLLSARLGRYRLLKVRPGCIAAHRSSRPLSAADIYMVLCWWCSPQTAGGCLIRGPTGGAMPRPEAAAWGTSPRQPEGPGSQHRRLLGPQPPLGQPPSSRRLGPRHRPAASGPAAPAVSRLSVSHPRAKPGEVSPPGSAAFRARDRPSARRTLRPQPTPYRPTRRRRWRRLGRALAYLVVMFLCFDLPRRPTSSASTG